MVVRPMPCCGETNGLGHTFVAAEVEQGQGGCMHCWSHLDGYAVSDGQRMWFAPRLIRIDPLSEPESVTQEEGVGAWESAQKCRRLSLIG